MAYAKRPVFLQVLRLVLLATLACAACAPSEAKPWRDGRHLRRVQRSLLQTPPTVVPGAAAISIMGKNPATCWDSSNGKTVVSENCVNGKAAQQWDMTSAGEIRVSGVSACVTMVAGQPLLLGPCDGGLYTKWNFASDGANYGPIKSQASLRAITVAASGIISPHNYHPGQANQLFIGVGKAPDAWTANADTSRTGWYASETTLTPATVSAKFGRLADVPLDGQMYAHPLVLNAVPVGTSAATSITRNVLLTASMANTLTAWDADHTSVQLWSITLGPPVPVSDYGTYHDITGTIGIVSTPVVDRVNSVVYCVCATKEGTTYHHRVHIIDIRSGKKRKGSGVDVVGSVPGTGVAKNPPTPGQVPFQSFYHLQRPALLLAQGQVWLAFGSHGDKQPYHGWIFTYAQLSLKLGAVFCITPNGRGGAIWMVGNGLAFDGSNVYVSTGNSGTGASTASTEHQEETLKLALNGNTITVADFFRPFNAAALDSGDKDYGTGGTLIIPGTRLGIANDKTGEIYVLDLDKLGGFQTGSNSQIPQSFKLPNRMFVAPCFANDTLYIQPSSSPVVAYKFNGKTFATSPSTGGSNAGGGDGGSGGALAVSGIDDSIIVWAVSNPANGPTMVAYNRLLDKVLWTSRGKAGDKLSAQTKFAPPVIANGRVYVMTDILTLSVYGQ